MMWYERLFGDTSEFGIHVRFRRDPHPPRDIDDATRESWGSLAIWARGRCLTRCELGSSPADGVQWYLASFIRWLSAAALDMINEEPFPALTRKEDIGAAAEWFIESEEPPLTLRDKEEEGWYQRRSDWWNRHCIRAGFEGAVLPAIFIRRLGDSLEVSWDNETLPSTRTDLAFIESSGSVLLPAARAAGIVNEFVKDTVKTLAARCPAFSSGYDTLQAAGAKAGAWRKLVQPGAAALLENNSELEELRSYLDREVVAQDYFIEHTKETRLLGSWIPDDAQKLLSVGKMLKNPGPGRLSERLRVWSNGGLPATRKPWQAGYEAASSFREEMGWSDEPKLDMADWLVGEGVSVKDTDLGGSLGGLAYLSGEDGRAMIGLNKRGRFLKRWRRNMILGACLGHILLDRTRDGACMEAHGPWTWWPRAPRARAFAAMLLMPEGKVRRELRSRKEVDEDFVINLASECGTGFTATTWHLKNLGLISEDERTDLVERACRKAGLKQEKAPKP